MSGVSLMFNSSNEHQNRELFGIHVSTFEHNANTNLFNVVYSWFVGVLLCIAIVTVI